MREKMLINGKKQSELSVFERITQFGDGVFETCQIENGKALFWELHFSRLLIGLKKLRIPFIAESLLLADIQDLGQKNGVIKIMISRGQSLQGYRYDKDILPTRIVIYTPLPELKSAYQLNVCQVRYCHNPNLAGIKHSNRLEQVLARAEVVLDEGIMLDEQGLVISATAANIFLIKDGVIKTPDLSQCGILGTRRARILQRYSVQVCSIELNELLIADAVFLTSSLLGVKPVLSIESNEFKIKLSHEISL
jgi:4-amino-4-deoxychorismate lyase